MGIKVACYDCGSDIEVSESWYNAVKRSNKQFRCKACTKLWRQQAMKNRMDSMSDEDKQKMYNKIVEKNKINYSKMSKEDIAKRMTNLQKASAEWRKNVTPEEKERISKIHTKTNKRVWEEYRNNPEKYAEYLKKLNNRWKNKTDEEKKQFSDAIKNRWNNYSYEELSAVKNRMKNGAIQRWENMDDDTKMELSDKISDSMKANWENDKYRDKQLNAIRDGYYTWWDNLPNKEERYKPIVSNMLSSRKEWWNNLPDSDKDIMINNLHEQRDEWWKKSPISSKEAFIKKVLTSSSGKNKLHLRFESRFNKLGYDLIPEYPTSNHGVMHCWDYAIFRDNELCMLLDLDGAYFHADICDYDGMHSKIEYDEKRGLSIPNNVKWCIIYEKDFDKSFAYMQSLIDLSYTEFIEKRVKEYRSMPFPYPEYTDTELMKSYRDLCKLNCDDKYHKSLNVNTRIGDRLIQHFHHSMYKHLLIDTWNSDESLRDMIKHGYLYHSYLNKNKILQGFNIYEPCKRTQYISAGKAKMIINKYLSQYDEVFDPFSRFSGCMLGCISLDKRYIGQDISEVHVRETNEMITFLKNHAIEFDVQIDAVSSLLTTTGDYECLFTCSPYGNKEQWEDVPVDTRSCDDWIDICLNNFKCKRYVFVVDETTKYKDNIADVITNKSHFGSNAEYVIIIEGGNVNI